MEQFPKQENEIEGRAEELEQKIKNAENFGELFKVLRDVETIQGSQETFTSEAVEYIIRQVREAIYAVGANDRQQELYLNSPIMRKITRTHGLRQKVLDLLQQETREEIEEG